MEHIVQRKNSPAGSGPTITVEERRRIVIACDRQVSLARLSSNGNRRKVRRLSPVGFESFVAVLCRLPRSPFTRWNGLKPTGADARVNWPGQLFELAKDCAPIN